MHRFNPKALLTHEEIATHKALIRDEVKMLKRPQPRRSYDEGCRRINNMQRELNRHYDGLKKDKDKGGV